MATPLYPTYPLSHLPLKEWVLSPLTHPSILQLFNKYYGILAVSRAQDRRYHLIFGGDKEGDKRYSYRNAGVTIEETHGLNRSVG